MTIIKHAAQRVAVFIDTQNLYHSAKNLYGKKVDFGKILDEAVAGRTLIRAVGYVISTESGDEEGFFQALENQGIETKTKDLLVFSGGAKKGDWDVGLTVDAIRIAPKVDSVVIVSGDGDFAPLVQHLQQGIGCQVEVLAFGRSSSSQLRDVVEEFVDLDEAPDHFLIPEKHRRKKTQTKQQSKQQPNKQGDSDSKNISRKLAVKKQAKS